MGGGTGDGLARPRLPEGTHLILAEVSWTRCRSMNERKQGATWGDIPQSYKDAWIAGAKADLEAAGLL